MKVCKADRLFLEELENYTTLSYLRKSEILHMYCRFKELGSEVTTNLQHRYEKSKILEVFPELSFNPFVDRMFHVFSSMKDDRMSFEDILDLASAFSEDCPIDVRARWAFLMYDFDGDHLLNRNDISEMVTRLTTSKIKATSEGDDLSEDEKIKVADIVSGTVDHYIWDKAILNDIVLCHADGITCVEFINEVKKIPEFEFAFRIKFM